MRQSQEILDEVNRVIDLYEKRTETAYQEGYGPWANWSDEVNDLEKIRDFILEGRDSIID
jgi:hypothetical protein